MHTPPSISYADGPIQARPASPSEFEHAYKQERGRWIRRRLIAYLICTLILSVIAALPTVVMLFSHDRPPDAGENALVLAVSSLVYVAALLITLRSGPVYVRALRIALGTYVVGTLLSIGLTHVYAVWSVEPFSRGVTIALEELHAGDSKRPPRPPTSQSRPASAPTSAPHPEPFLTHRVPRSYIDPIGKIGNYNARFTLARAIDHATFMGFWTYLLITLGLSHTIICLFIPWTVRESLKPAWCIAGAFIFMAIVDVYCDLIWWPFFVPAIVVLPFIFLPGTVICWWRYSHFNKQFKQRFESQGFKKLQEELVGARKIHEANLPAPIVEGPIRVAFEYEPMREIGGDLLMLHRSRGGSAITAVLLDVTGHGVSAALSVNRIVGEIERTFAENDNASPETLIRNLNQYIAAILAKHQVFATAIVARVDAAAGTLEYVNAGHPSAVLVHGPHSGDARDLESTAMMLGVCAADDFDCESLSISLAIGDALLLYTDGASEALNPADEMLTTQGVSALIRQAAALHGDREQWSIAVRDRVIEHRQSPPTDDMMIVTLWRA